MGIEKNNHCDSLAWVKTDADILDFAEKVSNGIAKYDYDARVAASARYLLIACTALLRDWFPRKDFTLYGLITTLAMALKREKYDTRLNFANRKSPLDLMFLQIEQGMKYTQDAEKGNGAGEKANLCATSTAHVRGMQEGCTLGKTSRRRFTPAGANRRILEFWSSRFTHASSAWQSWGLRSPLGRCGVASAGASVVPPVLSCKNGRVIARHNQRLARGRFRECIVSEGPFARSAGKHHSQP